MKYQHRVVGMLSLLSVITYIDRVCIAVAGPRIQDSLHISPAQGGWVTSVFFLSSSAFEVPSGALADRIGPRRVLTRIVLWWSALTSFTGMVTSYPALLIVRFCFGIGEAGAYPSASAVIARWLPARHRARAWGIVWMTAQIGAATTPLLVVPIQIRYGWQATQAVRAVLSDSLVRRLGLRRGRRTLGAFGLTVAAFFMVAANLTKGGGWALVLLSLAYAGILVQQPNLCAGCLDTGKAHAGTVFGFMNTAANLASSVSAIAFGYLVTDTGSYAAPFVPMITGLCVGAVVWLKLDPSRDIFEEEATLASPAMLNAECSMLNEESSS